MFGISRLLDRKPRQLSGGERQRVALARAVVREPVVFLLDEPLSNLDAKLRTSARDELKEFQHGLGTTTIYVTHDQVEAMGLGDRIAVLDHGRVRQVSTPSEIYHEPADTFVATFIGAPPMNLVEQDGTILGFRPEHFLPLEIGELDANGRGTADGGTGMTLPVRVTRIEYLGADQLVYAVLEPPFPETHVISRLPWMVPFTATQGERRDFVVRPVDLKRFDARTELRIDGGGRG
jgi:multiple sugar transport system ATP-binding protein